MRRLPSGVNSSDEDINIENSREQGYNQHQPALAITKAAEKILFESESLDVVCSYSCTKHSEMYLHNCPSEGKLLFDCLRSQQEHKALLFSITHAINTQQCKTLCTDKIAIALTFNAKCNP